MQKGNRASHRELGALHLRTLRSHLRLAEILGYGKHTEAQEHFEAFLKPQIGDLGKIGGVVTPRPLALIDHLKTVAVACNNYGACLQKLRKFAEAEHYYLASFAVELPVDFKSLSNLEKIRGILLEMSAVTSNMLELYVSRNEAQEPCSKNARTF